MKQKSTHPKLSLTALYMCACVWGATPVMAADKPFINFNTGGEEPKEESSKKNKSKKTNSFSSLNNNSVRIYPDVLKRDMHVVAKENNGKPIEFFVFDLEGTLIQNYKMKAKDHVRLNGLNRGKYQYRVFCGDIETAAGNFEIR